MPVIEVLLQVAPHIALGLASGQLERVGGVIRDSTSKQVVAWLREGGQIRNNPDPASALPRFLFQSILRSANLANIGDVAQQVTALSKLAGSLGAANNVLGLVNVAATARSHHLINLRLQAIQNMVGVSARLGMLQFTLSGFGLLLMLKRFADIEKLLEGVYEQVSQAVSEQNKRSRQVNLRAAIDSAHVVINAEDGHFKEAMAASLDFLLINAREHCLSDFQAKWKMSNKQDIELAQKCLSQAMHLDETRIRAFLEVGQNDLARSIMEERLNQYRRETQEFVDILLGHKHKRAVYFHENVKDGELRRYLLIEQWLRGEEDILWDIVLEQRKQFWNASVKSTIEPEGGITLPGKPAPKPPTRHLDALDQAEAAVENFQRFEGFALELDSISRLGISIREWESLENTGNTVFVNEENVKLDEHDDFVLLVERDYLESAKRLSA